MKTLKKSKFLTTLFSKNKAPISTIKFQQDQKLS